MNTNNHFLCNWRTTLIGVLFASVSAVTAYDHPLTDRQVWFPMLVAALGFLAKDSANVRSPTANPSSTPTDSTVVNPANPNCVYTPKDTTK